MKYCSRVKPHGAGEDLNQQKAGGGLKTVFIMSRDDSIGHCWFLFTLRWPFTLRSNLFSCDLQPRVHAVCHPLGPALANGYNQENRWYYIQRNAQQPTGPWIVCFLTLHFCTNKNYVSGDSGVKHDLNKLDFNKVFPFCIMEIGKWACGNSPIYRPLFHPSQLGGSNVDMQYNAFCNGLCQLFAKDYLRPPCCGWRETMGSSVILWNCHLQSD